MNNCFTQGYYMQMGWHIKVLLCFLLFIGIEFSLYGQDVAEDYRGAWQIETPDKGALVIIVKRNNLASYFRADNLDRTVYQGTWSSDATGALLQWQDGSSHRISRDTFGYTITYNDAMHVERYTKAATQLPEELLGQWAKAPSEQDERISDRDKAKGFFGNWKIASGTDVYYIIIEEDRSAASNRTHKTLNPDGLRGSWAKQGSELHIAWDSGHYGILRQNERNFSFRLIAPGTVIDNDLSEERIASRTGSEKVPSEWYARYTAEKDAYMGGIAFTDRKNASSFYRGSWIVQRTPDTFERIEIGRFGGLKTSTDHTLQGAWRINRQDIFMRWDDGMRKILSPVGQGFLLYEYKPGRPLDGVPTRIFSATPENAKKFAEHMESRQTVAKKLLSLAEANGIITSNMKDTGWGQSFMRWAWPFGNTGETPQPDEALLQTNSDSLNRLDPWWWPFWSELPDSEIKANYSGVSPVETVEKTAEPDYPLTTAKDTPQTTKKAAALKPAKADWEWPF